MKILIVDDDPLMQMTLKNVFKGEALVFADSMEAAELCVAKESFAVAFLDIQLKKGTSGDGIDLLKKIKEQDVYLPCVMISGLDDAQTITKCLELGAVDYVAKGTVSPEAYRIALAKSLAWKKMLSESPSVRNQPSMRKASSSILGKSAAIEDVRQNISKLATLAGPFLVTGETGTGKELVARALWAGRGGPQRPFIALNCASLPENLVESELFGYERGAFTGALAAKTGLFEAASGGDIFLDEIGEFSIDLQAKLLRVLQEKKVRRLGSDRERPVDFRVIAATNVYLPEAINAKEFREDLFYRLNVHQIQVPPLRDRKDDILFLLKGFLAEEGFEKAVVTDEAEKILLDFQWPGNVRQLRSFSLYLTAHLDREKSELKADRVRSWLDMNVIQAKDVAYTTGMDPYFEVSDAIKNNRSLDVVKITDNLQRAYVEVALKLTENNRSQAARILGVTRQRLSNWLSDWGIF